MNIEKCRRGDRYFNWVSFIFTKRIRLTAYWNWPRGLNCQFVLNWRGISLSIDPFSLHFDWYYKTTEEFWAEIPKEKENCENT